MPKPHWETGNYVKVKVGRMGYCYGVVTSEKHMAFLDYCGNGNLTVSELSVLPILFIVPMFAYSIGKHGWKLVGKINNCKRFITKQKFYIKEIFKDEYSIVDGGFQNERKSTKEKCRNLERAAVWSPRNVEARLGDAFIKNNRNIPHDDL